MSTPWAPYEPDSRAILTSKGTFNLGSARTFAVRQRPVLRPNETGGGPEAAFQQAGRTQRSADEVACAINSIIGCREEWRTSTTSSRTELVGPP